MGMPAITVRIKQRLFNGFHDDLEGDSICQIQSYPYENTYRTESPVSLGAGGICMVPMTEWTVMLFVIISEGLVCVCFDVKHRFNLVEFSFVR